jgi:hypothetical protein
MTITSQLSRRTLEEIESAIANRGIEDGQDMLEIRDRRLYLQAGFKTFEQYCRERWHLSKTQVNRLTAWARVIRNLTPMVAKRPNERQARELAKLPPLMQQELVSRIDLAKTTAKEIRTQVRATSPRDPNLFRGPNNLRVPVPGFHPSEARFGLYTASA